jgi:zinc/manganese transport system permease protein
VLSLAPGKPISGYVTTLVFLCYLGCRLLGRLRPTHRAYQSATPAHA